MEPGDFSKHHGQTTGCKEEKAGLPLDSQRKDIVIHDITVADGVLFFTDDAETEFPVNMDCRIAPVDVEFNGFQTIVSGSLDEEIQHLAGIAPAPLVPVKIELAEIQGSSPRIPCEETEDDAIFPDEVISVTFRQLPGDGWH